MRRGLWTASYKSYEPPFWPCPACGRETLQPIKETLLIRHPSPFNESELDPTEYMYRFCQHFACSIGPCGDVVVVLGDATLMDDRYSAGEDERFYYVLYPRGVYRGMPIIDLPNGTPESVRYQLETAFSLYWIDLGSCANKMRISVERALDELGIPPAHRLNDRIDEFEKIDPGHAQTFHALRDVGNVGSHEGSNARETVLDAFEVYEDALKNLFGGHRDRIEALKKKIRSAKGK